MQPGAFVGIAVTGDAFTAVADDGSVTHGAPGELTRLDTDHRPRWVWWDRATADALVTAGVHLTRCWDIVTVHRLQRGGWTGGIGQVWAERHGLDLERAPRMGQMGLLESLSDAGPDLHDPVRADGYLRPEWLHGAWSRSPRDRAAWAALALSTASEQRREFSPDRLPTAFAESTAELLCAELANRGLPFDVERATTIIADAIGPRPADGEHERELRAQRDRAVLDMAPSGPPVDLRNPADIRALLRRIELDLPDTRAWRLEQHRDHHRLIPALLHWRKAERLANTYGYRWLDDHVSGRRLRGEWASSDGAAGRMTASAGLHNLPAELRPAVCADEGFVFVRADLGQIEPRVLAAMSGDDALIAATASGDLYQSVADRLGVARNMAKVAVLGAMYGATTGESANALRGLQREFATAMGTLAAAAAAGQRGEPVFTLGGRPVHTAHSDDRDGDLDRARRIAAARGRFARNAIIQGSAAELFKMWALTVRSHGRELDAELVLCLHDELLVHIPARNAERAATMVNEALDEAAYRWSPRRTVRFVVECSVVKRWSEVEK